MLSGILRSKVAVDINIAIMRAFVAMRNYIMTTTTVTAELAEIRAKLALLERNDEGNAEAVNDLSEDMRKELDNIYEAIAALSVKVPQARKPRRAIGYKTGEEGENKKVANHCLQPHRNPIRWRRERDSNPGTVARTPHFECGPIDHSGISPNNGTRNPRFGTANIEIIFY